MSGNCETGYRATDTAPTMTVMIAMTMATIGRLMKKLDTVISSALDERVDYAPGFCWHSLGFTRIPVVTF
jgi:hypothetical protein